MYIRQQLATFSALFRADLWAFRRIYVGRAINFIIWCSANILVSGYLMLSFGTAPAFGTFLMVGTWAMAGMLDSSGRFAELVTDMCGSKTSLIRYATVPLRSSLVALNLMLTTALRIGAIGIIGLPLGKILLMERFDMSIIDIPQLVVMLLLTNLFYGAVTVLVACKIKSVVSTAHILMRLMFPLWFLGGFQFAQIALVSVLPHAALLNYLNPVMYIFEGLRGATLGNEGFVPVWICCSVLTIVTSICVWRGIRALQQRLDLL